MLVLFLPRKIQSFLAATSSSRSDDVTLLACLFVSHLIFLAVDFAPFHLFAFVPLHLCTFAPWVLGGGGGGWWQVADGIG